MHIMYFVHHQKLKHILYAAMYADNVLFYVWWLTFVHTYQAPLLP